MANDQTTQVDFPILSVHPHHLPGGSIAAISRGGATYSNQSQQRPLPPPPIPTTTTTNNNNNNQQQHHMMKYVGGTPPTTTTATTTNAFHRVGVSTGTNHAHRMVGGGVYILDMGGADTLAPPPTTSSNSPHWRHTTAKRCSCPGLSSAHDLSWRRLHMSRAKLKATATTSELLSGFAMIAMVELQINEPTNVPEWLFVMFAVCTTVLVAVHIFALMISTYLLPNIDAIAKLELCELVGDSPHERMRGFIQLAWAFSTVLGLFLFLVEVAILCWVKFWDYSFNAAIAATIVVAPVLVIFVLFAVHFYHQLVVYKCASSFTDMAKLEDMKRHLDDIAHQM